MSELFLSVFGVAAAIAFIFYKLGYTQGHRAAHCGNTTHSMAELEKAIRSASEALKSERASADFYRTRCKDFDELSELFNENLEGFQKYVNELRGDIIELKEIEIQNFKNLYHYTYYTYHIYGEWLEKAKGERSITTDWFDEQRKFFDNSLEQDLKFSISCGESKRKEFMTQPEED